MRPQEDLPEEFLAHLRGLEESYLLQSDPILQSGFGGGPARWRREREPILEAVDSDGDLLDVGCANGYLLECLVNWARERGFDLTPHGMDIGPRLIDLARRRLPAFATNLHVANAWNWNPPRTYRYVYTLWDCVPQAYLGRYCRRLLARAVAPGGRLIVGSYGSRSRGIPPVQIGEMLTSLGFEVAGGASVGEPPIARFAWIDADGRRAV